MKDITTLGIDLAKNVFQIHGVNARGNKLLTRRVKRNKLLSHIANMPPSLIGIEACGGSYYWARRFQECGHTVKLMAPQFVKPYVKSNKNDANDAEACCEAVTRPSMRFVPIKTIEQQDIQMLHRIRSRLVGKRTQLTNQIRGFLAEYGLVIAKGKAAIKRRLPEILEDGENELTVEGRDLFQDLYSELLQLEIRIQKYDEKIERLAKSDERCKWLETIPGIGVKTSTAFIAGVGDAEVFIKGRQLSAWLGLVPKQSSSGNRIRLGKISKRGDRYLRTLLVHGARSVVSNASKKEDRYSQWINQLVERIGFNKATVAVANKNARIAWALLTKKEVFKANYDKEEKIDMIVN